MIEVRFGEYSVDIEGHAKTAPEGQDLVCCAASTVLWALFGGLSQLEGVEVTAHDLKPGNGRVEAKSVPPEGNGMFMMAEAALRGLAAQFPDAVKIAE